MKRMIPLVACGLIFAAPAWACSPPAAPAEIPDGKSSTKETMLAAKKDVDRYKKDAETYLGCESNAHKLEVAEAELQRVADKFNAAVRAFKSTNTI